MIKRSDILYSGNKPKETMTEKQWMRNSDCPNIWTTSLINKPKFAYNKRTCNSERKSYGSLLMLGILVLVDTWRDHFFLWLKVAMYPLGLLVWLWTMEVWVPCVVLIVVAAIVLAGVPSVESAVVPVFKVPVVVSLVSVGKDFMLGEVAERP